MTLLVQRPDLSARVNVTESCWLWQGSVGSHGYGMVSVAGRPLLAHRYFYQELAGPIPDGLELDHLCRVPLCVRPDHLEPVTHRENLLRGMSRAGVGMRTNACMQGHPYTPENTYQHPTKARRLCRICNRERDRKRGWRRPSKAAAA